MQHIWKDIMLHFYNFSQTCVKKLSRNSILIFFHMHSGSSLQLPQVQMFYFCRWLIMVFISTFEDSCSWYVAVLSLYLLVLYCFTLLCITVHILYMILLYINSYIPQWGKYNKLIQFSQRNIYFPWISEASQIQRNLK